MPSRALLLRVCWQAFTVLALLSAGAAAEEAEQEGGVRVAQAAPPGESPPSAPPSSGDDIEEIVVLGAESDAGQDFSAADSVTGFGAEDLAALGAQSIADLASFTPNLEIVTSGATTPTFFIRGVGLNDFNPNSTGAVAVYQDDVAINAPAIQLGTLFDVEGVNVLRGPQGTGIARNASAGAIKIYARKPTGEFGGYLRSDFGNYEFRDYEGAVEAPIYEDYLAGRLAFRLTTRDGTVQNNCGNAPSSGRTPYPGGNAPQALGPWSICGEPVTATDPGGVSRIPAGLPADVNDTNNWAARGTLLFQPTLDSTFYLNAHGGKRDELSRLGQSIGTFGTFCHDPTKICQQPRFGVPAAQFDRSVASEGLLGFPQQDVAIFNNGYVPPETRNLWFQVLPCLRPLPGNPSGNCTSGTVAQRLERNQLKLRVANYLAKNLDPEPWKGQYDHTGPTTNDVWGGYLKSEIVLGGGLELTTTSGVDSYERLIDIDLDFSPETLFHIRTEDTGFQFYQDLALAGEIGETGAKWQIGGWYLREMLDVNVKNDFGNTAAAGVGVGERDFTQDTNSAAGFGYLSFDFLQNFTIDGGYRFNWEAKDFDMDIIGAVPSPSGAPQCTKLGFDRSNCPIEEEWMASSGTIRLTYRFREDTNVTWRYTRGYKPGSINATASQFSGPTVADPEALDAFEFGLHGSWLDGMLRVDASLFYYDYTDYQIFIARQFFGGTPEFVLLNANNAEVYGSEIDAIVRPWLGGFVQVRFSWLETQFLDFVRRDQFLVDGQNVNFISRNTQSSGNRLLNSPRFKVSLTGEQTVPLGRYGSFSLRYDGVWTDITYYDASEGIGLGDVFGRTFLPGTTTAQVPFWLHNLRGTWRAPRGNFEVALWVRNLMNESYKTFAFDGSNFLRTTIYFVGDPRTFGLSALFNF